MAAISCKGRVVGHTVILEDGASLPEGAMVEVLVLSAPEVAPHVPAAAVESSWGGPSLEQLIEELISDVRSTRIAAARQLGELKDPRATDSLLEAMHDRSEEVRGAAAAALLQIGPATLEYLIAALVVNEQMRKAAQQVVGEIDPNWVKSDAARAAIPAIAATLKSPHSFYGERQIAAKLLGDIGDASAVELLTVALKKDESRFVRSDAAHALAQIGDVRGVKPLLAALSDQEPGVHEAVAAALGMFGAEAVDLLLDALEHRDGMVRKGAAEALSKIGDPRALEPLLPLLQDEDPRIREAVVEAIGPIADARAVEPLIKALADESRLVRLHAVGVLGQIDDPRSVPAMINALHDNFDEVRQAAVRALQTIGDPAALKPLVSVALHDKAVAAEAIAGVQRVLEVAVDHVPTAHLQTLARFQDVMAATDTHDNYGLPIQREVDCSRVRELAREELKRRGVKA